MFGNIGTVEIIIIGVVLMILFGTKKIPEFAKGLGEAGREFRKGLKDDEPKKKEKKEE
jgi:sec-independent protein translocase protein TatA